MGMEEGKGEGRRGMGTREGLRQKGEGRLIQRHVRGEGSKAERGEEEVRQGDRGEGEGNREMGRRKGDDQVCQVEGARINEGERGLRFFLWGGEHQGGRMAGQGRGEGGDNRGIGRGKGGELGESQLR